MLKVCAHRPCSSEFSTRDKRQKFCSKRCSTTAASTIHGFYLHRQKTCEAPGCGKVYEAQRLSSRFCSTFCRVQFGQWSFRVARYSTPRVFGEAK